MPPRLAEQITAPGLCARYLPPEKNSRSRKLTIVPLTEETYQAICAFGLVEKMPIEWRYLFYNPKDAFKQILLKGMLGDFHDVETGKVIKEGEENF